MARHLLMRNRFQRTSAEGGGGGGTGGNNQGGSGGTGGEGGNNQGGNNQGGSGNQDPPKYNPPASQEEFDRIIEDRLRRERSKYPADWEKVAENAGKWVAYENESKPERERAVAEAEARARADERAKALPMAVRAEFKAAAKGLMGDDAVKSLLEDLDLTKFVTASGEVDEEKIAKKVAALAPAKGSGGQNGGGRGPGFGQGSGHDQSTPKRGEAGLAEARRRFPELQNQGKS